jgi:predicted NBD/HSP70 family sugar kinase
VSEVLAAAGAGDAKALAAVRETGRWVGRGAANLINVFNPDLLVFGGALRGVFLAAEPIVRQEIRRQALSQAGAEVIVTVAGLGSDSVLIGAAELGFSEFLAGPMRLLAIAP